MKRHFLYLVVFTLFDPSILFPEHGQRMAVNGYDLHISVVRLKNTLSVSIQYNNTLPMSLHSWIL